MNAFFEKIRAHLPRRRNDDSVSHAVPPVFGVLLIGTVVALNILLYTLVNVFSLVIAPPERDNFTLSGTTDTMFRAASAAGKSVTVMFCMPEEELKVSDTGKYVYETARRLAERHPGFLRLSYINILTLRDEKGQRVDLTPYRTNPDGTENLIYKTSVIFSSYRGVFRVLTDAQTDVGFSDFYTMDSSRNATAYNGEAVLASMVMWVLTDTHKTAYFTTGHSESADVSFRNALMCAGYYVRELNLRSSEVPADAGLVVISAPQNDFERAAPGSVVRTEMERLSDYVAGGGNLYVSLHAYLKRSLPVLETFLADFGIRPATETLANGTTVRRIIRETENAITTDGFTLVANYADGAVKDSAARYGGVLLTQTPYLLCEGGARPLLVSSPTARPEADGKVVGARGIYTLAAYTTTTGGGCVFVIPSVYATATDAMTAHGYSNCEFLYALCEHLFGAPGEKPYGAHTVSLNGTLLENLTMGAARNITILLMSIPVLIGVAGFVVLRRRRNR